MYKPLSRPRANAIRLCRSIISVSACQRRAPLSRAAHQHALHQYILMSVMISRPCRFVNGQRLVAARPVPLHEGDKISFGNEILYGIADAPTDVPTRNPFIFKVVRLQGPSGALLLEPLSAPAEEASTSQPPGPKQTYAAILKEAPRAPKHVRAGSQSPQRVGIQARTQQKPGPSAEPPVARQPARASSGFQEAADKAPKAARSANYVLGDALDAAFNAFDAQQPAKLTRKQRKAKRGESSSLQWLRCTCRPHVLILAFVLSSW